MRRRRIPYEKRCENCNGCVRISDGKYICEDAENVVVISDYKRTDEYMRCKKKVKGAE